MQKIYIELKQNELQWVERLLNVNEYEYYIYTHNTEVIVAIDIEAYQLNTVISILQQYKKNNSSELKVFISMDIDCFG